MMDPVLVKLGAKLEPQKMKPPRLIGCVGTCQLLIGRV